MYSTLVDISLTSPLTLLSYLTKEPALSQESECSKDNAEGVQGGAGNNGERGKVLGRAWHRGAETAGLKSQSALKVSLC